jgi:2-polyprenyl-6-methoxyphenol hydroxylase-like FAD-dependent oxidoreductase
MRLTAVMDPGVMAERGHAVVIGASIAGLATARVLSERFARVTVLERHPAPDGARDGRSVEQRRTISIAPQGRYPHILLAGGGLVCDRLFPDFKQQALDAGAPTVDRDTIRWWSDGWRVKRPRDTQPRVLASRALIETIVRRHVERIPNVRIDYGTSIDGLVVERDRVVGVRVHGDGVDSRPGNTRDSVLAADLVVDCGGRGSRLGSWLERAGVPAPPVTELDIDLCYQVLLLPRRPTDLDGTTCMIVQNMAPHMTRQALALALEGERWMVVLGGYFGDMASSDRAGYLAFADSLPVPEIGRLLRMRAPIADPMPYRFRSSRRVHCERLPRWPVGLVALGDATCSFNPLYGQGMSVALMQAEHLGTALDRGHSAARLARTIQRELAAITDPAWRISAGGDLAYPQVVGERPAIGRLIRRYMTKVFRACCVDPEVVDAMFEVGNLLAPPSRLLRPALVARVLRAQRAWRAQQTTVTRDANRDTESLRGDVSLQSQTRAPL